MNDFLRSWGLSIVCSAVVFVAGVVLGVAAGVNGVLEALRVSPSYHIEDGREDVTLRFRLGPFVYAKPVVSPQDNQ